MKITRSTALLLAAAAFGATAAAAQSTADPAQATPPTAQAPAATATAPLTNGDVTDSDVNQFATAVLAVQKVEGDASIADSDKQAKMAAVVQDSGMTPEKFNEIAKASQSDPALMKRIQTAAAAQMQASPDAATGSASGAAGSR